MPKFTYYDRDGRHYIVVLDRDNRGDYVSVYLNNLLGKPVLTRSRKEGTFIPDTGIGCITIADALELANLHFPDNVVTLR